MSVCSALPSFAALSRAEHPEVDVLIEVPRGSFLKRDPDGKIHFISPLPCPYNYGAVPAYLGLEGDLLDVVVLGPRLPFGTRKRLRAWGAITLTDRGQSDDKLICSELPPTAQDVRRLLQFFRFYARCKAMLNTLRGRPGRNACEGWLDAADAIHRASPVPGGWIGPAVPF